ncbi:MAG: glucosyl-3-phosphoglycerate synthase [Anaerolineales bacterium]
METFHPFRVAIVPVLPGCGGESAFRLACWIAEKVHLIGIVPIREGEASTSSNLAFQTRIYLQQLRKTCVRSSASVIVSSDPWMDLRELILRDSPDLFITEVREDETSIWGDKIQRILENPPCDIVLVHGLPEQKPRHVLIAARGGPYAELALQVGMALHPVQLDVAHISTQEGATEPPFKGLERIIRQMPEVRLRSIVSHEPLPKLLEVAQEYDLLSLGVSARQEEVGIGPFVRGLMQQIEKPLLVVKTKQPIELPMDERSGRGAISVLVDKWFAENTFDVSEFSDLEMLLALKRYQGVTVSLALPALNEEQTVGNVIRTVKQALMDEIPLLDEIVLIDSNSTDRTREIAAEMGIPVYIHQHLLPRLGARHGKGEALWKSLLVTRGDIVLWIDTDIVNIQPHFVYGLLGPLLQDPAIQFVKGFYRRPIKIGDKIQAGGGGRVTELVARPLLNLFYPELSGMIQPLAGEYGGRREALERLPFFSGYGVEIGLLIEVFERYGLRSIAQVDLKERIHRNQDLEALGKMSFAIIQAVLKKLGERLSRELIEEVNKTMKLIRYERGTYYLELEEIAELERPPMITIPEYRQHRGLDEEAESNSA